jgi:hypothetical protein
MAAPSLNAGLVNCTVPPDAAVELEVDDLLADPPPPEPHATVVARRARASVRSTGSFYPKEGM